MKRKRLAIAVCILSLMMVFQNTRLFAGTFNDTVEQAKSVSKDNDSLEQIRDIDKKRSSSDDDDDWTFFEFLLRLCFELYPMDISPVVYGGYPYAPDNFISFYPEYNYRGGLAWTDGRSWWCTTGGSIGVMYGGLQSMSPFGQLSLESQFFKCIGPDVDICMFSDDGDPSLIAQMGIRQSLLQFNSWTLAAYIGYGNYSAWLTDTSHEPYSDSGFSGGLDLRIFPFEPLTLRARIGFIGFDSYSITDWRIGAGYMIDNMELFLEHRTFGFDLEYGDTSDRFKEFSTLSIGTRFWL